MWGQAPRPLALPGEVARTWGGRTASGGVCCVIHQGKGDEPQSPQRGMCSPGGSAPGQRTVTWGLPTGSVAPRDQWHGHLVHIGLSCCSSRYRHAKLTSHTRVVFFLVSW